MSYGKCPICGEYDWIGTGDHKCPPIYYYKHEYYGEEFEKIRAWNFDDAAKRFARLYNEGTGDYPLMNGDGDEVIISDGKEEKTFQVFAEQSIAYSTKETERR